MFTGEYRPSVDEKSRIAIPTKLRKSRKDDDSQISQLQEWVFSYGYDHCIMGMPRDSWDSFVQEKIAKLSKSDKENRQRIRFFLSGAFECELDKQGRFILPQNLKDYARIEKELVIIGVGEFIEIWDERLYRNEVLLDEDTVNKIAADFWS